MTWNLKKINIIAACGGMFCTTAISANESGYSSTPPLDQSMENSYGQTYECCSPCYFGSARPQLECGCDFFLIADFFYFTAREEGLSWAMKDQSTPQDAYEWFTGIGYISKKGKIHNIDPDWNELFPRDLSILIFIS